MSEWDRLKAISMISFIFCFLCCKISSVRIKWIFDLVNPNVINQRWVESVCIHLWLIKTMHIIALLFSPEHGLSLELNGVNVDPHSCSSSHEQWCDSCYKGRCNSCWVSEPWNSFYCFISLWFHFAFLWLSSFSIAFRTLVNTFLGISHHPVPITALLAFSIVCTINLGTIGELSYSTLRVNNFVSIIT